MDTSGRSGEKGNRVSLVVGNSFRDEPGIYDSGEFGVRREDDRMITEKRPRLSASECPSFEDPFENSPH
jgi:Xaa-Pro dipeptidase